MVTFAFFIKDVEEASPSYVTWLNKTCVIFPWFWWGCRGYWGFEVLNDAW